MERTRTLIAPPDRDRLARTLERLSAGMAIRRDEGRPRLVRAEPEEFPAELRDDPLEPFKPFDDH